MMERIDLAPLLREAVATSYTDLVTRPTGVLIRSRIEARIAASPFPFALLDFTSIGLLDFSCADEVVAKLLLGDDGARPRFVVLRGVSESHRDALDHVLEHRQLTIVALAAQDLRPCLLGLRTPDLLTAFDAANRIGPGDAHRLAETLGWTVERAADALQSLALRRLIHAAGGTFRPLPLL
ncbi:MAG: hypothetical protein ABI647_07260 [Gemmatimonadota bacterium]